MVLWTASSRGIAEMKKIEKIEVIVDMEIGLDGSIFISNERNA